MVSVAIDIAKSAIKDSLSICLAPLGRPASIAPALVSDWPHNAPLALNDLRIGRLSSVQKQGLGQMRPHALPKLHPVFELVTPTGRAQAYLWHVTSERAVD